MISPKRYAYPINLICEIFHYNEIFMDNIILPNDIEKTIEYVYSLLKPQEVKILKYRYINNFTYKEISKIVNLSPQGIRENHNRIINKLYGKYKEYFQMGKYMVDNKDSKKYLNIRNHNDNSIISNDTLSNIINSLNKISFLKLTSMDSLSISKLSIPKEDIVLLNQHSIFNLSDLFSREDNYVCDNIRVYNCNPLSYSYGISEYSENIILEIKGILRTIEKLSIYDFLINIRTKDHYKLLEYFQILNLYLLENVNQYDFETVGNKLIKYVGNSKVCIIPDNIKIIEKGAFENCTFLERVIFSNSIEVIEENVFSGCTSLTIEYLPPNLRIVYYNSFCNCANCCDIDNMINELSPHILVSNSITYTIQRVEYYSKIFHWSKQEIIMNIKKPDFYKFELNDILFQLNNDFELLFKTIDKLKQITDDEIQFIVNNIIINYNQNALTSYILYANEYRSEKQIHKLLRNKHRFEEYEISYAEKEYNLLDNNISYETKGLNYLLNSDILETNSKIGFCDYLAYNDFDIFQIEYAIKNINVDFKQNALNCLKKYTFVNSGSKRRLYRWLVNNGFTQEEIDYAIENITIDFKQSALNCLKHFIEEEEISDTFLLSRKWIYNFYADEDFELEEIDYAIKNIKNIGINFKQNALNILKEHIEELAKDKICYLSRKYICDFLKTQRFELEEIDYAIKNINIDFKQNALNVLNQIASGNKYSKNYLFDELIGSDYLFTIEESKYAIKNCNIDFKQNALDYTELKFYDEYDEYEDNHKIYNFLIYEKFELEDIRYVIKTFFEDYDEI